MTPFRDHMAKAANFYPTEPGAVSRILAVERITGSVWEPACGDGTMAREIAALGHFVYPTDLHDWGYGDRCNFVERERWRDSPPNIVTNPPFRLAEQFVRVAIASVPVGGKVIMLMRLSFLEGAARARGLFTEHPPARVWVVPERMTMYPGRQRQEGDGGGTMAMAWYVWEKLPPGYDPDTRLYWLPTK